MLDLATINWAGNDISAWTYFSFSLFTELVTAAQVVPLRIHETCKAVDHSMVIGNVKFFTKNEE